MSDVTIAASGHHRGTISCWYSTQGRPFYSTEYTESGSKINKETFGPGLGQSIRFPSGLGCWMSLASHGVSRDREEGLYSSYPHYHIKRSAWWKWIEANCLQTAIQTF
ncbi:Hypothetical protein NTJ_07647 [Nesidiocoris tenuis]|uniref:Uncharacterized protein n=1 Tax=Nesidiocoris tenuis TaxID=355587 RepID=A0ABN7AWJ5_9HEMI|nr:Hypothetical protein NTJ_07647 [Nesidiocoris tenuis]